MKRFLILLILSLSLALFIPAAHSTVVVQNSKIVVAGTNSPGPFGFGFPTFAATDITVIEYDASFNEVGNAPLMLNIDYTISGLPVTGSGTGNVILTNPLPFGYTLVIMRTEAYLQGQNWNNLQSFTATSMNQALDRLEMQIQQLYEMAGRSFMATPDLSGPYQFRPAPNTVLGFDSNGNPTVFPTAGGNNTSPTVFSSLPACASGLEGAMRPVTDSTTAVWGATITGTSTNHVLAYCDGTNWTVMAK